LKELGFATAFLWRAELYVACLQHPAIIREFLGDDFLSSRNHPHFHRVCLASWDITKREVGMRRVLFTSVALLLSAATAAVAADLPRRMPTKAPAYVPATYNWTGFYLGINGGYGFGRSHWSDFATGTDTSGGMVGGTIGYNWQALGSPWVFGLEGDIDWTDIKGNFVTATCPTGCQTKNTWLGTARGRVGYAWDRVMPYITGGAAFGDIKATQLGVATASDTNVGWTAGGGVEGALAGNLTAKLEYLHVDLGSITCTVCAPTTRVGFHADEVRAGLNYRF
jgi:outer membrane immunogenic protein